MNKIKILIADDHAMLRYGLKQILELENDLEVIGQAGDGDEAIELAKKLLPDVILMDINMPGTDGIQAIEKLKLESHQFKIIVLTIHEDREYLLKTIHSGAVGYILKDTEPDILIKAIRTVYQGQSYIQPSMTKDLIQEVSNIGDTKKEKDESENVDLTEREIEVINLIADGLSNKEIASELKISEKTVKNHVSNLFKKLNIVDRTQAAIYAFKHNLKR
jgi:DNA-binding NarL/FixJ family response regulator